MMPLSIIVANETWQKSWWCVVGKASSSALEQLLLKDLSSCTADKSRGRCLHFLAASVIKFRAKCSIIEEQTLRVSYVSPGMMMLILFFALAKKLGFSQNNLFYSGLKNNISQGHLVNLEELSKIVYLTAFESKSKYAKKIYEKVDFWIQNIKVKLLLMPIRTLLQLKRSSKSNKEKVWNLSWQADDVISTHVWNSFLYQSLLLILRLPIL